MTRPVAREHVFTLPFALESLNTRDRKHFGERHRAQDQMKLEVLAAIGGTRDLPRPPFARARVTVVRCSAGQLDPDNAYAACKGLLDVLCVQSVVHPHGLGIIADDSPRHLDLIVRQTGADRGDGSTLVWVEELEPLPDAVPVKPKRRPSGYRRTSKAGITHGITSAMQAGLGRR